MAPKTARSSFLSGRVRDLALCFLLTALPPLAQPVSGQAQLLILNAGINLGWIDGIVATEGVTAANVGEIGIDLANASNAITALIPLIPEPYESPYWGRFEITFNETFTRFTGSWSRCDGSLNERLAGSADRPR